MEKQLKNTLKEISAAARERQRREFGRHGEGEGGSEESDSGDDGRRGGGDRVISVCWDGDG